MSDPLSYESRSPDSTPAARRICPKCEGPMEEGILLDRTEGGMTQATWIAGPPEKLKFFGIPISFLNIKKRPEIPVATYRCTNCGYLESYATNL